MIYLQYWKDSNQQKDLSLSKSVYIYNLQTLKCVYVFLCYMKPPKLLKSSNCKNNKCKVKKQIHII